MDSTGRNNPNALIYGVDVGNGYGKVSILLEEKQDPIYLMPDSLLAGMPSTVYASPDGDLRATKVQHKRASRAIDAVKTKLNEPFIVLEEKGQTYQVSPCDAYAAIARDLIELANEERQKHNQPPVHQLVLTYPAGFKDRPDLLGKLKTSVESVVLDGQRLKVCGMISEPAAVALDYLYYMRNLIANPIKADKYTILVYDLGHGTFDTAVVTAYAEVGKDCELHCQNGDGEIGGKKFDDLLFSELLEQVYAQTDENAEFNRESLRNIAVEMKHELSTQNSSEMEFFANDEEVTLQFTQVEFAQLIMPQIMKTLEVVNAVREEAKGKGVTIDAIVLSGGSSQIPFIKSALLEMTSNKLPVEVYRPNRGVTYGAARYAYNSGLVQHVERSCGIRNHKEADHDDVLFLLNEDAKLPCISDPYLIRTAPSGITKIWLRRADTPMPGAKKAPNKDCVDILQIPIELPPNEQCSLRLRMDTNRCIFVDCTLPNGKVITKSTFCHDNKE